MRITESDYDRYYEKLCNEITQLDSQLSILQETDDNYFITIKYLLELANRAHELFIGSEVEEKRQLIKLVLSNLVLNGKKVCYEAKKPFDIILNCAHHQSWLLG